MMSLKLFPHMLVLGGNCLASCYCSSPLTLPSSVIKNRHPIGSDTSTISASSDNMFHGFKHGRRGLKIITFDPFYSSRSILNIRAGASNGDTDAPTSGLEKNKCPFSMTLGILYSLWGSVGVVYILAKAIKRVVPIALEPFQNGVPLTTFQLGSYIATCLFFAYAEGYKGFQRKFSPLVVSRSFSLTHRSPFFHALLGPAYSMGLFHSTKKRMVTSWSVTIGVAVIVTAVKKLAYPWRNIVDAGVVVGLTWGSVSILAGYVKALVTGRLPKIDPALPSAES